MVALLSNYAGSYDRTHTTHTANQFGRPDDNVDVAFDWDAASVGASSSGTPSTFPEPVLNGDGTGSFKTAPDFDSRMHQYELQYGDRARYSLACVLDGTCSPPVLDGTDFNPPQGHQS